MYRVILTLVMLLSIPLCFLPSWAAQGLPDSNDSRFDMTKEQIGDLRLGMSEKDLAVRISCKQPQKSKEQLEGATGEYVQDWKCADCGIKLKLGSERRKGLKVVQSVTVTAPCSLPTTRGIHIGSTEDEVLKAYGQYQDRTESKKGRRFLAGSIYEGMIFDFKNGKVVRIFLGAAAE
jgi:hypothetical protein